MTNGGKCRLENAVTTVNGFSLFVNTWPPKLTNQINGTVFQTSVRDPFYRLRDCHPGIFLYSIRRTIIKCHKNLKSISKEYLYYAKWTMLNFVYIFSNEWFILQYVLVWISFDADIIFLKCFFVEFCEDNFQVYVIRAVYIFIFFYLR